MSPKPVEFKVLKSHRMELNEHRNVFCPAYDACLKTALKRSWDDFSCAQCPHCHSGAPRAQDFALHQPHVR